MGIKFNVLQLQYHSPSLTTIVIVFYEILEAKSILGTCMAVLFSCVKRSVKARAFESRT